MSEAFATQAVAQAVEKRSDDPRWDHEVTEGGIYDRLGDQINRYREAIKALETRLSTALENELADNELKLQVGPGSSPLRRQVEDLAALNADLEAIVRRIEL